MTAAPSQMSALEQRLDEAKGLRKMPDRFEVGVLFVHGIGEQQRGDTLTEAGDVLVEWLRRWLESTDSGRIDVLHVALHGPPEADADGVRGAHAIVRILQPEDHPTLTSHWLVAESWWADTFRAASFSEFAAWGLGVGPWVASSQLRGVLAQTAVDPGTHPLLRAGLYVAAGLLVAGTFVVAAALSLFFFVLASLLFVLRLIPIGPVQGLASSVQRTMALGFGDAFALVRSPVRFGAMATQVRADLRTMTDRCDRVAVIAHSQGTTIAWAALQSPDVDVRTVPKRATLFITYGQALRKLKLLRFLHSRGWTPEVPWDVVSVGAVLAGLGAAIGLGVSWLSGSGGILESVGAPLGLAMAAVGQWRLLSRAEAVDADGLEKLAAEFKMATDGRPGFRWLDFWASADPFSNGPMVPDPAPPHDPPLPVSYRVHNLASPVSDHSVYWQNLGEFVTAVAGRLGNLAGMQNGEFFGATLEHPLLRRASIRRRLRTEMLTVLRATVAAAAVAVALGFPDALRSWGEGALCAVNALPLVDLDLRSGCGAPGNLAGLAHAAGVVIVVFGFALAYVLALLVWRAAVRGDDRALFAAAGGAGPETLWPARWRAIAIGIAAVAAALVATLWVGAGRDLALVYAAVIITWAAAPLALLRGGSRTLDGEPVTGEGKLAWPLVVGLAAVAASAASVAYDATWVAGLILGAVIASLLFEAVRQVVRLSTAYWRPEPTPSEGVVATPDEGE